MANADRGAAEGMELVRFASSAFPASLSFFLAFFLLLVFPSSLSSSCLPLVAGLLVAGRPK